MIISKNELIEIRGGINITSTLINSLAKGIDILLEVGRSLGGSIRRMIDNNACPY